MLKHLPLYLLLPLHLTACSPGSGPARHPGNATPVAAPRPGPSPTSHPRATPSGKGAGGLPGRGSVPVRADEAPLVRIREALESDSLLGRRVRVSGQCTARGEGRRAGSWTLESDGASIEVRGLVPPSCAERSRKNLTIFAQIEPTAADSKERLLLRLPD